MMRAVPVVLTALLSSASILACAKGSVEVKMHREYRMDHNVCLRFKAALRAQNRTIEGMEAWRYMIQKPGPLRDCNAKGPGRIPVTVCANQPPQNIRMRMLLPTGEAWRCPTIEDYALAEWEAEGNGRWGGISLRPSKCISSDPDITLFLNLKADGSGCAEMAAKRNGQSPAGADLGHIRQSDKPAAATSPQGQAYRLRIHSEPIPGLKDGAKVKVEPLCAGNGFKTSEQLTVRHHDQGTTLEGTRDWSENETCKLYVLDNKGRFLKGKYPLRLKKNKKDRRFEATLGWISWKVKVIDQQGKELQDVAIVPVETGGRGIGICKARVDGLKVHAVDGCDAPVEFSKSDFISKIVPGKQLDGGVFSVELQSSMVSVNVQGPKWYSTNEISVPREKVALGTRTILVKLGNSAASAALSREEGPPDVYRAELPIVSHRVLVRDGPCDESGESRAVLGIKLDDYQVASITSGDTFDFVNGVTFVLESGDKQLSYTASERPPEGLTRRPDRVVRKFEVWETDRCSGRSQRVELALMVDEDRFHYGTTPFEVKRASSDLMVPIALTREASESWVLKSPTVLRAWYPKADECTVKVKVRSRRVENDVKVYERPDCDEFSGGKTPLPHATLLFGKDELHANRSGLIKLPRNFDDLVIPVKLGTEMSATHTIRSSELIWLSKVGQASCASKSVTVYKRIGTRNEVLPLLLHDADTAPEEQAMVATVRGDCRSSSEPLNVVPIGRDQIGVANLKTNDKNVRIELKGDHNYRDEIVNVTVANGNPNPQKLTRRWPGVLVLLSLSSELMGLMDAMVQPLSRFLVEQASKNPNVVFAYADQGVLHEKEIKQGMKREDLAQFIQDISSSLDSRAYGLVHKDLDQAKKLLSRYNRELLGHGYRNRLLYVVPADYSMSASREAVESLTKEIEIVAVEVSSETSSHDGPVVFRGLDIEHFESTRVDPSSLKRVLDGSATFWPAFRNGVKE